MACEEYFAQDWKSVSAAAVALYGRGNSPKEVEPEGKAPSLGLFNMDN